MSWTYKPELDELEKDIQRDESTDDRWTFHRYMYFEPSQYDDWSKGKEISGVSHLMELKDHPSIPSAGVNLTGALSAFYVKEISSIDTMTSEDHMDQLSYGVVDILYENKKEASDATGGFISEDLKPWELPVEDFLVSYVANEVPAKGIKNYDPDETTFSSLLVDYPRNSANDVIYDMTMPNFTQRITWSVATKDKDFSFSSAFVNNNEVTFWNNVNYNGKYHTGGIYHGGKITIAEGKGLFLPPSLKRAFYKNKNGKYEAYDVWSYEVIVDPQGHTLKYKDVGKRALSQPYYDDDDESVLSTIFDICAWYTITPDEQNPSKPKYLRDFGDFDKMMEARDKVNEYNQKLNNDTLRQATFYGDFVQEPVPLHLGEINKDALSGTGEFYDQSLFIYEWKDVDLGTGSSANIAFRAKVEED